MSTTVPSANVAKHPSPAAMASQASPALAFLVHSQETVQHNLPPSVDNKLLARQKRRRTSPEDQRILEAEYQRNPKPDKAARLDLVARVALGEKEVQIWFQNRRQNSRRKSRPLESHEIMTHLQSSSHQVDVTGPEIERSDASEVDDSFTSHERTAHTLDCSQSTETSHADSPTAGFDEEGEGDLPTPRMDAKDNQGEPESSVVCTDTTSQIESQETLPTQPNSSQLQPLDDALKVSAFSPKPAIHRRSASCHTTHAAQSTAAVVAVLQKSPRKRRLGRVSSYLRLSMTDDGHAQVIDRAAKSPSPAKIANILSATGGLRRSYSAAGLSETLNDAEVDQLGRKSRRTSAIGRSRDSRAWEFWCDSDARNSLVDKANSEVSGSAADAISHIVASNKALRANHSRRNIPFAVLNSSNTGGKVAGKPARAPLSRAATSFGRLQSRPMTPTLDKLVKPGKANANVDEYEMLTTESDKENWEPNEQPSQANLQQEEPLLKINRRILGENTQALSQRSSLGAMMEREQRGHRKGLSESVPREVDSEVDRFMRTRSGSHSLAASASSGEEFECVQSLLSLSQGNWR